MEMAQPATAKLLLGLALTALLILPADRAEAQGYLAPQEVMLAAQPKLVNMTQWQGRPALAALVDVPEQVPPGRLPRQNMTLIRLEGGKLVGRPNWELPRELRWIEPLALPGGKRGWLGLIGTGWYRGEVSGAALRWELLCRCPTLFAAGKGLLPFKARFVYDLDGDGASELLLPNWNGLMVYRQSAGGPQLLWRVRWEIREHYEVARGRMKISLNLPRYLLQDVDRDGVLDFLAIDQNTVAIARLPKPVKPPPGPYFVLDGESLARVRRLDLPAPLLEALEKTKPGSYRGAPEFLAALNAEAETPFAAAQPGLDKALAELREENPVVFPLPATVPGLGAKKPKETHIIQNVMDMDGDGVLDLIHLKSTDTSSILDQTNQLRWYKGSRDGAAGLSFSGKPQIFFSEGPVFAQLVFPRVGAEGSPLMMLATTEVNLLAVIRAFTLNKVSLDLFAYPWREGKLVVPPPVQGKLAFQLKNKRKKNRPMVVLADLTGDGTREYLFNMDTDTLTVFRAGTNGPDFGAHPLARVELPVPHRPDTIFVSDLDGDKREDLLFWYPRGDNAPDLRRTLRVLQYREGPAPKGSK